MMHPYFMSLKVRPHWFRFSYCSFGMLHMEIIQERLEREYDLALITTAPTVVYQVVTDDDVVHSVDNPSKLPVADIAEIREPIVEANILVPQEFLGNVITLCVETRCADKYELSR